MAKIITITGAGGTVGLSLLKYFMRHFPSFEIRAIDRSEAAISTLIDVASGNYNVAVFLADLMNYSDIEDIVDGSEAVIHCAAMKHVIMGSKFPEELAFQNISCFRNIVKAAKKCKVKKVLLCSTDKASTPTSVMGISKLLLEKIALFSSNRVSKFSAVRFGNILNSSGSIIPKIITKLNNGEDIVHAL